MTFTGKMTLWLGKLEVQLLQLGRGHTKGDTVVWLPQEKILFSGDLVEFDATPYAGDAYFRTGRRRWQHRGAAARPSWCPAAARRWNA
jgi:glyoxylase-like metal-dependent hydrolase (beta-lactamase superfamily II)